MINILEKFLNECLELTDYKLEILTSWNQNITWMVEYKNNEKFIIQAMLSLKTPKDLELKEEVFKVLENSKNVKIAKKLPEFDRFYEFENCYFQVMEKLEGRDFHFDDFNEHLALEMTRTLAYFHTELAHLSSEKYDWTDFTRVLSKILPIAKKEIENSSDNELKELYDEMISRLWDLKECEKLPKWILHSDPIYRNFMVSDDWKELSWIIDYERICYNSYLWDIADLIRWFLRFEECDKNFVQKILKEYETIRILEKIEKENLENYLKMINLDVAFRFLLSEFNVEGYRNMHSDSRNRIKRYLNEFDMVSELF